jgi:hypothetical protein
MGHFRKQNAHRSRCFVFWNAQQVLRLVSVPPNTVQILSGFYMMDNSSCWRWSLYLTAERSLVAEKDFAASIDLEICLTWTVEHTNKSCSGKMLCTLGTSGYREFMLK